FYSPPIRLRQRVEKAGFAVADKAPRVGAVAQDLVEQSGQADKRREDKHRDRDRKRGEDGAALVAGEISEHERQVFHGAAGSWRVTLRCLAPSGWIWKGKGPRAWQRSERPDAAVAPAVPKTPVGADLGYVRREPRKGSSLEG